MRTQDITLFVDTSSLLSSSESKFDGRRIDYKTLWEKISETHGPIQAGFAYGYGNKEETDSFRAALRKIGFELRWSDFSYNWSVGIAMEVVCQTPKTDLIILCSSDPIMAPCARWVRHQGVKFYVYGCKISGQLKEACDQYFEMKEDFLVAPKEPK